MRRVGVLPCLGHPLSVEDPKKRGDKEQHRLVQRARHRENADEGKPAERPRDPAVSREQPDGRKRTSRASQKRKVTRGAEPSLASRDEIREAKMFTFRHELIFAARRKRFSPCSRGSRTSRSSCRRSPRRSKRRQETLASERSSSSAGVFSGGRWRHRRSSRSSSRRLASRTAPSGDLFRTRRATNSRHGTRGPCLRWT